MRKKEEGINISLLSKDLCGPFVKLTRRESTAKQISIIYQVANFSSFSVSQGKEVIFKLNRVKSMKSRIRLIRG